MKESLIVDYMGNFNIDMLIKWITVNDVAQNIYFPNTYHNTIMMQLFQKISETIKSQYVFVEPIQLFSLFYLITRS